MKEPKLIIVFILWSIMVNAQDDEYKGIQTLSGKEGREYYINDTDSFKVLKSIQVFNEDTFDLFYYYSYGKLVKEERSIKGKILSVSNFLNGKIHGFSSSFKKDGRLYDQAFYNNGELIMWIQLYDNGMIKSYTMNDSITKVNDSKEYYKGGELKRHTVVEFKSSKMVRDIIYYKTGKIMSESYFESGKQRMLSYTKDGVVFEDYYYIDLNFYHVGELKFFYDNGQIKKHAFYKDGKTREEANIKTGTWKYWNEKGELVKEEKYKANELIDVKEYMPLNKKLDY